MTSTQSSPDDYLGIKDLARRMGISTKGVKRWWHRIKVPPTVPAHAALRWSPADARKFLERWTAYTQARRISTAAVKKLVASWR